jgi:hypothetical protein
MQELEHITCLETMCEVIGAGEDRLLALLSDAAPRAGGLRGPRSEHAWRDSVRGLSDAIFQAVYGVEGGYAEGPAHGDPVIAYGVVRGRAQLGRGVAAASWREFMDVYHRAYVELVRSAGFEEDELDICIRFLDRVFERIEAGFTLAADSTRR